MQSCDTSWSTFLGCVESDVTMKDFVFLESFTDNQFKRVRCSCQHMLAQSNFLNLIILEFSLGVLLVFITVQPCFTRSKWLCVSHSHLPTFWQGDDIGVEQCNNFTMGCSNWIQLKGVGCVSWNQSKSWCESFLDALAFLFTVKKAPFNQVKGCPKHFSWLCRETLLHWCNLD